MTEEEWMEANFAILFMQEAETIRSEEADPTVDEWRAVATRVACLLRLGPELPEGVRDWVAEATAYLDREVRGAPAGHLLDDNAEEVYQSFREAYAEASPELRQKLAAAQDVFRGRDYYAAEEYMIEDDESSLTYTGPVYAAESSAHCDIIRDIFGNPFRPVALDPTLMSPTVVALATTIYADRAFDRLPILADALADADCEDEQLLEPLRGPGPHVRGCWGLDLILGKS